MNTNQIKSFAKSARINLCAAVEQKIRYWGFHESGESYDQPIAVSGGYTYRGEIYNDTYTVGYWQSLKARLSAGKEAFQDTVEEAAYTWFNRLMAIKILEKNGFIPPVLRFREGSFMPEILQQAKFGQHSLTHSGYIANLQEALDHHNDEVAFAILIKNFCDKNPLLTEAFGGVDDYTQILLPQNLLTEEGFLAMLNDEQYISEEDYREVELIGWLYQFYISDKKDEVFANKKEKFREEDIPAATQIFTPRWIVSYMVENTLGKAYIDYEPDTELKAQMRYLVEDQNSASKPLIEDITELSLIDPAAGSGHILVVGMEWLYQMYLEQGYAPKAAVQSILEHNLYGLDIDERAAQLARFAVLLKGAQLLENRFAGEGKNFLMGKDFLLPHIYAFPEAYSFTVAEVETFTEGNRHTEEILKALRLLYNGKNIGSALKLSLSTEAQDYIKQQIKEWDRTAKTAVEKEAIYKHLRPYLLVALNLAQKYTAAAANPPYMGSANMNAELKNYLEKHYPMTQADLCTVFIEMFGNITMKNGKYAFITPPSWMFLSTYEKLRHHLLSMNSIDSLLHLSRGVFGADFGSVSCVITNRHYPNAKGTYFKLLERTFQEFYQGHLEELFLKTLENHDFKYDFSNYNKDLTELEYSENGTTLYYPQLPQDQFDKIPGSPIAYWASEKLLEAFVHKKIMDYDYTIGQNVTGNNEKYVRFIWEISRESIGRNKKWLIYAKGGEYRKWEGNLIHVINWSEEARKDYYENKNASIIKEEHWYRKGITWGLVSSSSISFRVLPENTTFDKGGTSIMLQDNNYFNIILGLLNSKTSKEIVKYLNPTINYQLGDIRSIPVIFSQDDKGFIDNLVDECISISKYDWNTFETAWDFTANPLVNIGKYIYGFTQNSDDLENISSNIADAYEKYKLFTNSQFEKLKKNEETLNEFFIHLYGLEQELDATVPEKDITIAKIFDKAEDISEESKNNKYFLTKQEVVQQLLSYLIGVLMGRYRLDREGVQITHQATLEETSAYSVAGQEGDFTFTMDDDGIIPMMGVECGFPDDVVRRIEDLIEKIWGDKQVIANLNFINEALGMPMEKWLTEEFWPYHLKKYSKRPIYWLFCSNLKNPKKSAFRVLCYMHRMDSFSLQQIIRLYLHPHQEHLRTEYEALKEREATLDKAEKKRLDTLPKLLAEIKDYGEKIKSYANQQIALDLDNGVVRNFAIFQEVLPSLK